MKEPAFRKVIENADGTFDMYKADSLEGLVKKIAEAKRSAFVQMSKVQAEKRELAAKTAREGQMLDASVLRGSVQAQVASK
jgi:3-hydroxyisobutyrate dehydrogenase-like beta-hydroxyacid dehydrogenase